MRIEDNLLEMVDFAVQIPMYAMDNSLNMAMAFGIAAYEILHCRLQREKLRPAMSVFRGNRR